VDEVERNMTVHGNEEQRNARCWRAILRWRSGWGSSKHGQNTAGGFYRHSEAVVVVEANMDAGGVCVVVE
jgi:hypothetical protein